MLSSLTRRLTATAANNLRGGAFRRNMSGHGAEGTVPGENLPFDINNKYKLTLLFTVFFGSGLAVPFLAVRHQLLKQ